MKLSNYIEIIDKLLKKHFDNILTLLPGANY